MRLFLSMALVRCFVFIGILCSACIALNSYAAQSGVPLDHIKPDIHNQPSLQRGMGLYMNYCLGCHGLSYARYERTANDLGIPIDLAEESFLTEGQRIGDLMTTAMPAEKAARWFGKAPPDLTLLARAKGADYIYSYMRSFYRDDTRPFGVNNLVFPSVGMPHVLLELQGLNECVPHPPNAVAKSNQPCASLEMSKPGRMDAQAYDAIIYDLVNFMVYISEPAALIRYRMGTYVMLFLLLMLVFTWLLKREYWKDIH